MRDDAWLEGVLSSIWDQHFSDVVLQNQIKIIFGRRAKRRLGSISLDRLNPSLTIIRVNGLFRDPNIPLMIIKATIAHELCHYAHGFNSGGDQVHRHPHANGVMRAEFAERGLEDLYIEQKKWLRENWSQIVVQNFRPQARKSRQRLGIFRFI